MRLSQTVCRFLVPVLTLAVLAGCKTKNPPDQPTVLGTPPNTAYLGVDYYYDFGGYGGSDILKYTLSNAPPWMGLEETTNKARSGIVLHGVPGITGGHRGAADLGKTDGIAITATDGSLLGSGTFSVTVRKNELGTSDVEATEGKPSAAEGVSAASTVCDKGDTSQTGTLTANNVSVYDSNNVKTGTTTKTYKTYPVLIPVTLTKPSVEDVTVAWDLATSYDATCQGVQPSSTFDHDCEFSPGNLKSAQLGKDVVGTTGTMATTPGYLQYTGTNSGTLTIPAGKSTCFIRVEVADDNLPEQDESFHVELTGVRKGLADLGPSKNGKVTIHDNQPTVSFSRDSDAISVGGASGYTATLSESPSVVTTVPLNAIGASTIGSGDYEIQVNGTATKDLVFQPGEQSRSFTVKALNGSSPQDPFTDDMLLDLGPDKNRAYGHEDFVFAGDSSIAIDINEWVKRLQVGQSSGFVPNSMAVGDFGRVFLAGVEGGKVKLKVLDRFSNDVSSEIPATAFDGSGAESNPYVAYNERTINIKNAYNQTVSVPRREVVVAFDTDGALSGQTQLGGLDAGVVMLRRQDSASHYRYQWNFQLGSPGNDIVRGASFDPGGNAYLGGITDGVWPQNSASGKEDAFAARINNQDSTSDNLQSSPVLNWERQWGSTQNDNVVSVFNIGSTLYAAGTTTGAVDTANHVFGGIDGFFSKMQDQSGAITNFQFGTQYDDNVMAMTGRNQYLFVTGGSVADYQVGVTQDVLKDSPSLNSENGFLLHLYATGAINTTLMLKDPSDTSTDLFDAISVNSSGDRIFTGGETDGVFTQGSSSAGKDLILARTDVETDSRTRARTLKEIWRIQQDSSGDEKVIALGLYGDKKLVALVRTGSDQTGVHQYQIRLYKLQDGTELTSP